MKPKTGQRFPKLLSSGLVTGLLFLSWITNGNALVIAQEIVANQPGRVLDWEPATDKLEDATGECRLPSTSSQVDSLLSDEIVTEQLARQAEAISTANESTKSTITAAVTVALLGLAPIVLLMTTCYVRLFVVLSLLRQALGAQQLPSNQMLTALSFFVTLLVMTPVWQEIKTNAVDPATRSDGSIDWRIAFENGIPPLKRFMTQQIQATGNRAALEVFFQHQNTSSSGKIPLPENIEELPINIVLPAFMVSELKVAFLLGFQIFLPFLILDLVVSTLTVSMGMVMLPPAMVSLPLKWLLFVMVDGWNLVIGMLLQSFGTVV
ncbi:MAG: flagellar type III secretion system pore protein FliP [Pirellulaceae bacterium]